MWCSNCKYRVLTTQTKCTHCGRKLVEDPQPLPDKGYRYLTSSRDAFDLQLKLGLLSSCQISAVRGYMPDGAEFEVYSEQSGFGNDLFVAIDQFESACEIIKEQTES